MTETRDRHRAETIARLRRVEGQIRGIQRMIEEQRDCEAIVTQLMAARSALDRASLHVVTHHIEQCLVDPSGRENRRNLNRIVEFFLKLSSVTPESGLPVAPVDET